LVFEAEEDPVCDETGTLETDWTSALLLKTCMYEISK